MVVVELVEILTEVGESALDNTMRKKQLCAFSSFLYRIDAKNVTCYLQHQQFRFFGQLASSVHSAR